jgi:hypothetical protein
VLPDSNPVHIYSGEVTTTGRYSTLDAFKLEKEDELTETSLSSFEFRFKTFTHKDGVNWRTTGSTMTFDISQSPGKDFIVYIGKEKAVPTTDVFSFKLVAVGGPQADLASGVAGGSVAEAPIALSTRVAPGSVDAVQPRRRNSALQLRALNRARI